MDPLEGVLHADRLDRFCLRFGLRRAALEANFDGWHKRVILSPDSAFLFPRYDEDVPQVRREAAALAFLHNVDLVPTLIGAWDEPGISPYPFLQTERRFGTSYDDIEDELNLEGVANVLERLGAATAAWHSVATDDLPDVLSTVPEHDGVVDSLLSSATLRGRLEGAQQRLASVLPPDVAPAMSWVGVWERLLRPLTELPLVLTHGDVHESQLLVDDHLELVAVLDWDHAGLAHPVRDFNFGEWGFGIFAWEERFDELYRRYWDGYRSQREQSLPDHHSVLLLRTLADAIRKLERPGLSSWFDALRLRRCAVHVRDVTVRAG